MQRKVFRVEQMFAKPRAAAAPRELDGWQEISGDALKRELAFAQDIVAQNRRELAALIGESKTRNLVRAAGELGAAVAGMEKATQKILQAAEAIDEDAKALGAALKSEYERRLAQDIQDRTVEIYEASNFQDLAGQRIAKVVATLNLVEQQLSVMLARCNGRAAEMPAPKPAGGGLLNGPRLDGDPGHASQGDIDSIFA